MELLTQIFLLVKIKRDDVMLNVSIKSTETRDELSTTLYLQSK